MSGWKQTHDQGRQPESAEMFDSDMAVYVGQLKARQHDPAHIKTIQDNIRLMKRWAAEGR